MYLVPVYRVQGTGLYDTRTGMILIYSAICIPFSLFVYRGFYTTIPREIEEAAKLDGCGPMRSFLSVFLPQSLSHRRGRAVPGHLDLERPAVRHGALPHREGAAHHGRGGHDVGLRRREHPWIMTAVIFTSIPTILLFVFLRAVLHPGHGAFHHRVERYTRAHAFRSWMALGIAAHTRSCPWLIAAATLLVRRGVADARDGAQGDPHRRFPLVAPGHGH